MSGIMPTLTLLMLVLVAAVPWAMPSTAMFILPLLLIIAVFVLSLHRKGGLPAISVFAAGLLMDILTAGPLGYWAIIFLLTHTLTVLYGNRVRYPGFGAAWMAFASVAVTASIAGWLLASVYFVRVIDWQPMAIGGSVAILLFPLVAWPMRKSLGLVPVKMFSGRGT